MVFLVASLNDGKVIRGGTGSNILWLHILSHITDRCDHWGMLGCKLFKFPWRHLKTNRDTIIILIFQINIFFIFKSAKNYSKIALKKYLVILILWVWAGPYNHTKQNKLWAILNSVSNQFFSFFYFYVSNCLNTIFNLFISLVV